MTDTKIVMTSYGIGVALSSPCCDSPMNVHPREPVVDQLNGKITTTFDFICLECQSLYAIDMQYNRIHNIEVTVKVDL